MLKLFYAENGSRKPVIFEKWQDLEKWQKWPYCIGKIGDFEGKFKSTKNIGKTTGMVA